MHILSHQNKSKHKLIIAQWIIHTRRTIMWSIQTTLINKKFNFMIILRYKYLIYVYHDNKKLYHITIMDFVIDISHYQYYCIPLVRYCNSSRDAISWSFIPGMTSQDCVDGWLVKKMSRMLFLVGAWISCENPWSAIKSRTIVNSAKCYGIAIVKIVLALLCYLPLGMWCKYLSQNHLNHVISNLP